jgi:hypothetical protein
MGVIFYPENPKVGIRIPKHSLKETDLDQKINISLFLGTRTVNAARSIFHMLTDPLVQHFPSAMGSRRKNDAIGPNQLLNFYPTNPTNIASQTSNGTICHNKPQFDERDGTILGRRRRETVQHEQNFLGGSIAHPCFPKGLFHGVIALTLFGSLLWRDLSQHGLEDVFGGHLLLQ